MDRRLRVLVRDLGLFVIVDGERGLAQESRVLDPGVLADPDSAGVTDEAGVGKIVVGRGREVIDFRFLLHGGLRLGGVELRQDACDWRLCRGVRRLSGLPRDRDHTQIVDGVVGVETGQVCHVQAVVDPAHGCRQGRRGQRGQIVVVIVPEVPVESEGAEHQCGHCDQDEQCKIFLVVYFSHNVIKPFQNPIRSIPEIQEWIVDTDRQVVDGPPEYDKRHDNAGKSAAQSVEQFFRKIRCK